MSNQPTLDTGIPLRTRYGEWLLLSIALYAGFLVVVGPVAALIAWQVQQRRGRFPYHWPLTVACLLLLALIGATQAAETIITPPQSWLLFVFLLPLVQTAGDGMRRLSAFLKPRTLQQQLDAADQARRRRDRQLLARAERRRERAGAGNGLRLGTWVKGDHFSGQSGIAVERGWVLLDEPVLDQHLFLLGATGAGKSETIKRLVAEILARTDRHVYFVDGKGDEQLADAVRALAFQHGRGAAPVFKLGFARFGAVYDGFRGHRADIYNRLCALVGATEARGDAQYYADINRDLLQLICYAPAGPPRSFEALRERLSRSWLTRAYADNPVELAAIHDEVTESDIRGLARRIRPLAREFAPCIGEEGFCLEESPCAVFSLRAQSVGDTSRRFLDFLVEDLKDFIGKRQHHPAVLIIDEFGQFSNRNITALLSLARSAQLGIVLATHDVASLMDETTKKLVLANTRTKLLMASEFPEEVGQLAGTIYQIESSLQHEQGERTGLGSARIQHAFKVDMNEVAGLQPGEAFVIRQRQVAKVKVRALPDIPAIAGQPEEKRSGSGHVPLRRKPPRL